MMIEECKISTSKTIEVSQLVAAQTQYKDENLMYPWLSFRDRVKAILATVYYCEAKSCMSVS